MKTTKLDFEVFQEEFLRWVELFGLKEYELLFYHLDTKIQGTPLDASLLVNSEGKFAEVTFSLTVCCKRGRNHAKDCAKHEAIHLLLEKLTWIAGCRFLNDGEIKNENEAIVRRLEKVLK